MYAAGDEVHLYVVLATNLLAVVFCNSRESQETSIVFDNIDERVKILMGAASFSFFVTQK